MLNIVALLFYSQKKEEEKISLKKMSRGVIQKVVTDGRTDKKQN